MRNFAYWMFHAIFTLIVAALLMFMLMGGILGVVGGLFSGFMLFYTLINPMIMPWYLWIVAFAVCVVSVLGYFIGFAKLANAYHSPFGL